MKILLFSDLHAHNFKPYATILPNGMNSRLADAVSCINQIRSFCEDPTNGIDLVLFGGDLFHVRRNINVTVFNAVYDAIAKFQESGIQLAKIHGNHDQADRKGEQHSLHAFTEICDVFIEPCWCVFETPSGEKCNVLGIPYTENIEQLRDVVKEDPPEPDFPTLMLGHFGVQGALVGADFVYINPHDPTVEDLNAEAFDHVFLGHYHLHQKVADNVHYIGAPMQHNWGDSGQNRGFLVYDTETKEIERHYCESPWFVEVDKSHKAPLTDCFVRIIDDKQWSAEEIEERRSVLGARVVEVVPPSASRVVCDARIPITTNTSMREAAERYVRSGVQPSGGLEESYLLQIGTEILEEVE